MSTVAEIPTFPGQPFDENVTWVDGTAYALEFKWNTVAQCWVLDISDTAGNAIIMGIPLVTGADLLEQFGYMPVGAQTVITVMSIGPGVSPDTVPDFENLGSDGHVYLVTP